MKTQPNKSLRSWQLPVALSLLFSAPFVMGVQPQITPAQFDIMGQIQKFTLDNCTYPHSALSSSGRALYANEATPNALTCTATIVLNGHNITLPANTVVTLPASFLTPYELFAFNPLCKDTDLCTETGLAMLDANRMPDNTKPATYEASIQGNVIYNAGVPQYVAGLVKITQEDLNSGEGFITDINYATGEIRVGGNVGANPLDGVRVRINDPVGRFGRRAGPYGDNGGDTQDIRFAVDDGNPTILASTGYPLCIPRFAPPTVDAICPETNRPLGIIANGVQTHLGTFSMPPAAGVNDPGFARPAAFPATIAGTDPTKQAPLEIGDYIHYAGTQAVDTDANGAKSTYVSAHTIEANLGIYTTPGTDPAYVRQEVTIVGVGSPTGFIGANEGRELFKVVGFTTDVVRPIDTGKVITDPCDGSEAFGRITTDYPNGSSLDPAGKAAANVPLGRFRSQFLKGINLGISMIPATKEIRSQIQGSTYPIAANGITSGQYTAPVNEYILPENLGFGGLPVINNNFEDFQFLTLGHGPWDLYDPYAGTANAVNAVGASPIQGQLAPWPGLSPSPATVNCVAGLPAPPVIVVSDATVASGAAVTLNATGSFSPSGVALSTFSWRQTGGPALAVFNGQALNTTTLSFTAPKVNNGNPPVILTFALTVTDLNARSSVKTVKVTVQPQQAIDSLTIPVAPTYRKKDGSWNVNVVGTDNTATVSIEAYNSAGTVVLSKRPMTQTPGQAVWSFVTKTTVSLLADNVLNIRVTSSKGGASGLTTVSVRIN